MIRIARVSVALALSAACVFAGAETVSAGSLSRDEGSSLIIDTLNSREWLGWDVVRDLSYAQTVAAVAPGGIFDGFRIANNVDAQKFVNSLVGSNSCTATQLDWVPTCFTGEFPQWERLVGESYLEFRSAVGAPGDHEAVKFLNWAGGAGILDLLVHDTTEDSVYKGNVWETIPGSDRFTGAESFGWLLFRDVSPPAVPEPESSFLFLAGLLAIFLARRHSST